MEAALEQPVLVLNRLWQAVNVIGATAGLRVSWPGATPTSSTRRRTTSGCSR